MKNRRAFTLIEVLIAMSILVFITAFMIPSLASLQHVYTSPIPSFNFVPTATLQLPTTSSNIQLYMLTASDNTAIFISVH